MANQTRVTILDEVSITYGHGGQLCLHAARYDYPDGSQEHGFRFIWRKQRGNLLPQRGQARLPSLRAARILMAMADDRPAFGACRGEDADDLPASVPL